MPRVYTQSQFFGNQISKADDFLDEAFAAASEFNGLLDQNNMPLSSVASADLKAATVTIDYVNATYPAHKVCHTYQQSQAYHVSVFCGTDPQSGLQDSDSFTKAEFQLGWQRLAEKRVEVDGNGVSWYPGAAITFNALDGMLVGEAMVDLEWRASYTAGFVNPDTFATIRYNTFIEVGVFINDVCCARTDRQWLGGRFTYVVPFSTPCGTGPTTADIRIRIMFESTSTDPSISIFEVPDVIVTDSKLWIRNQYR